MPVLEVESVNENAISHILETWMDVVRNESFIEDEIGYNMSYTAGTLVINLDDESIVLLNVENNYGDRLNLAIAKMYLQNKTPRHAYYLKAQDIHFEGLKREAWIDHHLKLGYSASRVSERFS